MCVPFWMLLRRPLPPVAAPPRRRMQPADGADAGAVASAPSAVAGDGGIAAAAAADGASAVETESNLDAAGAGAGGRGRGVKRSRTATNRYEQPKPKNLNKRATAQALARSAGRLIAAGRHPPCGGLQKSSSLSHAACRRPHEAQGCTNRHGQGGRWRHGT